MHDELGHDDYAEHVIHPLIPLGVLLCCVAQARPRR